MRWLVLAAALLVAAFLRFDGLGEPSYWVDEILHQNITTESVQQPLWKWLTGFEPENGPLYYATQLATRLLGSSEAAGRAAAALFGLLTIVLIWLASRDGVAALLLAIAPLHVYYSREARPYALLMMLTAAMIIALLRRHVALTLALLIAFVYTAAASAPVLMAMAIVCAILSRERFYKIAAVASLVALAALPLLYRGASTQAGASPQLDVLMLLRNFSVTALSSPLGGRAAIVMLILAIIGAVTLDRKTSIVITGMTVLPLAFALGALAYFGRYYAPRYVAPALIGYLLLVGAGIAALAKFARQFAPVVAWIIVAALATQSWNACRTEAWQKPQWRLITQKILEYAKPGDLVLSAEPWSGIPLDYYLARSPQKVEDVMMPHLALAQRMVRPGTWLVSAGFDPSPVRDWMCTQPLVMTSALDNFRMHYAGDFLRERARAPELRALAAGIGDAFLYGEGWAGQEDGFRWALGTRATLLVPGRHAVRINILPFVYKTLPPQRVNGQILHEGWQELRVGPGVVTLDFARAVAPVAVDPNNKDPRPLAAAVADPHAPLFMTRIDLPDARKQNETRFPANQLRKEAVIPLLGRLGLDPQTTWPQLARGEVHLEDLAERVAWGSDCEDDATYVRRAFTILMNRAPGDAEVKSLLGIDRIRVAGRIVKSEEFRSQTLRVPGRLLTRVSDAHVRERAIRGAVLHQRQVR